MMAPRLVMVRVAMVVTNGCAPDPRVLRHARWMQETGCEVTVHAFDREEKHPMSQSVDGVRIMRYRIGKVPYGGTISTYYGIRRFQKTVINTLRHEPPNIVYCHDADTLRVGCALKESHDVPFVFDMHDLQHSWVRFAAPQSAIRRYISHRMKASMLRRASLAATIITSSRQIKRDGHPGFVEWLAKHGLQATAVENRPEPPHGLLKTKPDAAWTVGYIGRVRDFKSFDLLVQAIKSLPPAQRPKLRVAGDGTAAAKVRRMLMDEVEKGNLEAEVSGSFAQEELPELLKDIDVMYALYSPHRGNIMQGALPVKMFDAAAHGVPSVVNEACLMADVVETEALGASAPWADPAAIGEKLHSMRATIVAMTDDGEREHQRWLDAMADVLKSAQ